MRDDLHTYRTLRRIYLSQRRFYEITDRAYANGDQHRRDRIRQMLGKRRKYAPSLTNGRYDQYGCIRQPLVMSQQTLTASQDGASFYLHRGHQLVVTYTAPFKVGDYDMQAAARARSWFEATASADGYNFSFEEVQ